MIEICERAFSSLELRLLWGYGFAILAIVAALFWMLRSCNHRTHALEIALDANRAVLHEMDVQMAAVAGPTWRSLTKPKWRPGDPLPE